MSQLLPPQDGPGGPGGSGGGRGNFGPSWRGSQRRASVTLREEGGEDTGSLMDPATKSLSDALRITYRFIILAVILLVGFYILSGVRRVEEGERALRLVFGRVVTEDIGPGIQPSWPEPFGELIKVRTGAQSIAIEDDFFPQLTDNEKKQLREVGPTSLSSGGFNKVNPENEGSVLTGDRNIAHTRWAITYHREDPKRVVENLNPDFERSIVIAACKRGIVRAIASVSIDELLKNTPDPGREADWRTVENRARDIAQQTLDDMKSGIEIDILSMTLKIPPRSVISAFNQVQSSVSESSKLIESAHTERKNTLVAAAGDAAELLLQQISLYDRAISQKQTEEAARIMERIDLLMLGRPVEINGVTVNPNVYGQVATIFSGAESDRRTYVANLQGEATRFAAKLESFQKNPMVLMNSEWADAYSAIMSRPWVQSTMLPPLNSDGRYVITVGQDPEIAKRIQQEVSRQKALRAEEIRKQEAERLRMVTPTQRQGE